jgi:hypothetical protein
MGLLPNLEERNSEHMEQGWQVHSVQHPIYLEWSEGKEGFMAFS